MALHLSRASPVGSTADKIYLGANQLIFRSRVCHQSSTVRGGCTMFNLDLNLHQVIMLSRNVLSTR